MLWRDHWCGYKIPGLFDRFANSLGDLTQFAWTGHALGHHVAGKPANTEAWIQVLQMFAKAATGALLLLLIFLAVRPRPRRLASGSTH